jgi:alpha-galactosidase
MADVKIAFIGAGSAVFAMDMVRDLCLTPGLGGSTVAMMDIDRGRLDAVHSMATRYAARVGSKIRFEKTTKRSEALKDSDFVIDTVLAGGHYQQEATRAAGEKHGYYRGVEAVEFNMVADYFTTFGGYHQLKFFMDLARDMEDLCPKAWLVDVANPECEAGTLLARRSKIKVVGYCHGYKGYRDICSTLGLDPGKVDFQVAGFNHNIWLTRFRYDDRDFYPLIDEWILRRAERYWNSHVPSDVFDTQMSRAAVDMYRLYGLFPVGDTVRSGSWKYHYDLRTKKYWYGRFGGPDSEIGWRRYLKELDASTETVMALVESPPSILVKKIPPNRSDEDVVQFIDSVVNDKGERFVLDVRNDGLIRGLSDDVAVEVPVRVDRKGVHKESIEKIPRRLVDMALIPRQVRLEMAMEAFIQGDRAVLLEILFRDPRTRSEKQARGVLEEILDLPFNEDTKKHFS